MSWKDSGNLMKITERFRKYAVEPAISEEEALKKGAEVCAKAWAVVKACRERLLPARQS